MQNILLLKKKPVETIPQKNIIVPLKVTTTPDVEVRKAEKKEKKTSHIQKPKFIIWAIAILSLSW